MGTMPPRAPKDREATVENDAILNLLELIQENEETDLTTLPLPTQDVVRSLLTDVDTFLWKVSLRESSDEKVAVATVGHAISKLHDGSLWRFPGTPFRSWALGRVWRGQSPRFWLFKQAKATAQTLKSNPRKLGSIRVRAAPSKARITPEMFALMKGLAALHCSLRRSKRTRQEWRQGDCTGGCDLLFLYRENFSFTEINEGVDLPRAVVNDYVRRCEGFELELEAKGSSPNEPPPGPSGGPPSSSGGDSGRDTSPRQQARANRAAEADALIRQMVASYLTDDELQWRWESLCGARGALKKRSLLSSFRNFAASLFSAERRNSSLLGLAVATAAVVMALVMVRPEDLTLSAGPDSHRTGDVALPKNLRLDLKKRTIELSEGNDLLSGTLEKSAVEPVPGVSIFTITLQGKDETGVEGRFQGKLWLTNAPGATVIRKKSHIAGARIGGMFTIVGRSTNAVEQVFAP